MNIKFKFPVYHDRCDSCKCKFSCWTGQCNLDIVVSDHDIVKVILPSEVSLKCMKVEPWQHVHGFSLTVGNDNSMVMFKGKRSRRWNL